MEQTLSSTQLLREHLLDDAIEAHREQIPAKGSHMEHFICSAPLGWLRSGCGISTMRTQTPNSQGISRHLPRKLSNEFGSMQEMTYDCSAGMKLPPPIPSKSTSLSFLFNSFSECPTDSQGQATATWHVQAPCFTPGKPQEAEVEKKKDAEQMFYSSHTKPRDAELSPWSRLTRAVTSHHKRHCRKQTRPQLPLVPGNLITLSALKTPQTPQQLEDLRAHAQQSGCFASFSLRSADSEASHFAEALNSLLKCNLGSILFQLLCSNFNQVLKRKILKNHLKIQSSGTMWKWNGQAITQLEQKTITFTLTLLTHWAPALLNAAARRQREMPFHTQSCAPSSQLPREVLLPSAEISSFEQDRLKKKCLKLSIYKIAYVKILLWMKY